ncbi:MAG: SpoIID/LytB domain-containing protein [Oscillospiraceae bacterium]
MSSSVTAYASFDAAQAAADDRGGYPVFYNGTYYVRVGSYTTMDAASNSAATAYGSVVRRRTQRAGREERHGSDPLRLRLRLDAFALAGATRAAAVPLLRRWPSVSDRSGTRSCTYYGDFQFTRLSTQDPQKLTLVNFVGLEPYVKGVTPYEMSSGWPLEALKAQAVCARTYVASHMNGSPAYGFDVTGTTTSQVYLRYAGRLVPTATAPWMRRQESLSAIRASSARRSSLLPMAARPRTPKMSGLRKCRICAALIDPI